ncbi:MAG: transporter substrate-binding domain-containing protein [Deltaproteobacteria bacterium]|nr:transporter substrate-binding domain-containing protein [Deltaproteobacteria bacterium]
MIRWPRLLIFRNDRGSSCIALIFAMALCLTACTESTELAKGAGASTRDNRAGPYTDTMLVSDETRLEAYLADLEEIKKRGVLRILVAGDQDDFLPRRGSPSLRERGLLRSFCELYSIRPLFLLVPARDRILPLLLEGKGDVAAALLTVTKSRMKLVQFTRPTATVREILVGRKGDTGLPGGIGDLNRATVHVRASSSYAETLERIKREKAPGLKIVKVRENEDTEKIAFEVGQGERPLTVIDSNLLQVIETYNDKIQGLFPLTKGRSQAFALRKDAHGLEAALDSFLVEKAMTGHTREIFKGDLKQIRERGEIRVITRNNPVTYFLYRGEQKGFDYDLVKMLARDMKVRLAMIVPPSRDQLIPWLLQGKGDIIAASLTRTEERERQVLFTRPYLRVEEVLVQNKSGPKVKTLEDLKGKEIFVRRSSSYFQTLKKLQGRYGPFKINMADEHLETEELITMVGRKEIPFTVSDSHILKVELAYRDDIQPGPVLTGPAGGSSGDWTDLNSGTKEIAFAVRPGNERLKQYVDNFVKRIYRGVEYNMAKKRYFENRRRIRRAKTRRALVAGRISPYDDLFKKYSAKYGLDWRLMAAVAYQESRFDPKAKSWVGALGLFQVMPKTARMLGFTNPADPKQGIHAGIRFISLLIGKFDPSIEFRQRVRFALAGYNAGAGHVQDARRIAGMIGLDRDRWFKNVEKAMLLLMKPEFYKRARHGYCRGSEPVRYVSQIQNRYDNYIRMFPK